MKLVAISDVHCKQNKITIPECDILISAGDYSFKGENHEIRDFHKWLNKQPAKHKISLQGNHELGVERDFKSAKEIATAHCPSVHFIEEGLIEIEGLKIWCSAITPFFHNWAYNRYRGEDIKKHWDKIPEEIDILVTHGPPMGFLDQVVNPVGQLEHVGCEELLKAIERVKPKIHIFGHLHFNGGKTENYGKITLVNASICNEEYKPVNKPIVMEI